VNYSMKNNQESGPLAAHRVVGKRRQRCPDGWRYDTPGAPRTVQRRLNNGGVEIIGERSCGPRRRLSTVRHRIGKMTSSSGVGCGR
jgi:hypothetical protein